MYEICNVHRCDLRCRVVAHWESPCNHATANVKQERCITGFATSHPLTSVACSAKTVWPTLSMFGFKWLGRCRVTFAMISLLEVSFTLAWVMWLILSEHEYVRWCSARSGEKHNRLKTTMAWTTCSPLLVAMLCKGARQSKILVAPSTGWMLYYLCFTPLTAIYICCHIYML